MTRRYRDRIDRSASGLYVAARGSAGVIAAVAAAGLLIQARATLIIVGSIPATLWVLSGFFTIIANLLLAAVFAGVLIGWTAKPRWIAGAVLTILLVGVVYALLLRGLLVLSGGARTANALLHYATPILAPLWWLAFAPKGTLRRTDPWHWTLLPLAYLPWALMRGAASGRFAYPFLDLARHGWMQVAITCAIIAAGFVAAGFAVVLLDEALGRRARP